jgi:hypothetical protein
MHVGKIEGVYLRRSVRLSSTVAQKIAFPIFTEAV